MMVVRPLGSLGLLVDRRGLRLSLSGRLRGVGRRRDAVGLEDLIHGVLDDRVQIRRVARLLGVLQRRFDGGDKLVLEAAA